MIQDLAALRDVARPLTLVLCAGFEQRVVRAADLLANLALPFRAVMLLNYLGSEHQSNLTRLRSLARKLTSNIDEMSAFHQEGFAVYVKQLDPSSDVVAIDVTGLSRVAMLNILSILYDAKIKTLIIYTEAKEYYPTKNDFRKLTRGKRSGVGFLNLSRFEQEHILYSGYCEVEELPALEGLLLPNYPLMLIAFLTFKRGRVSAILQEYEANQRILIKSVPVRSDLQWRAQAVEIPNFDLLDDSIVHELETLNWRVTYDYLCQIYEADNNRFKFNFVLAPLGSKMQTIGSWLFAKERPEVKVVSSTPKTLYYEKYSAGYGNTFLFDDLPTQP
jgi:hypothetical protein